MFPYLESRIFVEYKMLQFVRIQFFIYFLYVSQILVIFTEMAKFKFNCLAVMWQTYSGTSRKRTSKMSSIGDRLQELRPYWAKFIFIGIWRETAETYPKF